MNEGAYPGKIFSDPELSSIGSGPAILRQSFSLYRSATRAAAGSGAAARAIPVSFFYSNPPLQLQGLPDRPGRRAFLLWTSYARSRFFLYATTTQCGDPHQSSTK